MSYAKELKNDRTTDHDAFLNPKKYHRHSILHAHHLATCQLHMPLWLSFPQQWIDTLHNTNFQYVYQAPPKSWA